MAVGWLLTLCLSLALVFVTGSVMTISPSTVTLGSATDFTQTLRCALTSSEQSTPMNTLLFFKINHYRPDEELVYASVVGSNSAVLADNKHLTRLGAVAIGQLSSKRDSYLLLTWNTSKVTCDDAGEYECEIGYLSLDFTTQSVKSNSSLTVHECSCSANLITRSQWGARAPLHYINIQVPVHEIFIHHTQGQSCHDIEHCSSGLKSIQNYHMNGRGWDDIGYSFLIGEDGNVYVGRGWDHVGAHTKGYNSKSFGIAFMGNYMNHAPGSAALKAAQDLIQCGVQLGMIAADYRLYGHRDAGSTDCPGDTLYKIIETWPHYSHVHP